jgi:asparagine synthase (glutamine-hydrolysing)
LFRYLVLVWHDEDCAARETARRLIDRHSSHSPEWQVALSKKGLFVGYAGTRVGSTEPHCLHGEAGVILGKLFERPGAGPSVSVPLSLNEARTRAILESRGRDLVEHYWGRYIAILHEETSGSSWVLRDPSGGLPCLTLRFGGVRLYFSSLDTVLDLDLGPFDVNWTYLTAWVCIMRGQTHATALREVSQVLPGECVELRDDRANSTFYWDPLRIANANVIHDPEEAARSLRDVITDCARAWASCYSGITLSLSGGLDSSILYAALRDSPAKAKLTCFHYYPTGSDMDERHYARLVAQSGGSPLIERPRDSTVSLKPLLNVAPSHEPTTYLYFLEHSRLDAALAAEHHATAAFTGWGGDQLFYQHHAMLAAGDYLHYRGVGPRFLRVALDAAQMDRLSVWHVLREAFAHRFQQRRWSFRAEVARARPLIQPEVINEVYSRPPYAHPLLNDDRGTPNGKLWHASQLSSPWEFYDPLGEPGDPERVSPLYSQPVLELCLRLPVHLLTLGGWDRAMARRAFYDELPREVANRRNKGDIERHIVSILDHNITFIRDLLLQGALVAERVVDRKNLAAALSGKPGKTQSNFGEILDLVGTEAWLLRWRNPGWRAAA